MISIYKDIKDMKCGEYLSPRVKAIRDLQFCSSKDEKGVPLLSLRLAKEAIDDMMFNKKPFLLANDSSRFLNISHLVDCGFSVNFLQDEDSNLKDCIKNKLNDVKRYVENICHDDPKDARVCHEIIRFINYLQST